MKLDINGHQVEVTPALREYAQEKIGRLSKHFDHHLDARIILSVAKLDHKAEATLHTTGKTLFADATAPDMYAAIDLLADKLDQSLGAKGQLDDALVGNGFRRGNFGAAHATEYTVATGHELSIREYY